MLDNTDSPSLKRPVLVLTVRILLWLKRRLHQLWPGLHDRVIGIYRGSGLLERRLQAQRFELQIDALASLIEDGAKAGTLEPRVVARLRTYVGELRAEHQGARR